MTDSAARGPAAAQVRLLGDLIGRAIAIVDGPQRLELVERVRTLAVAHRRGGDDAELRALLRDLPAQDVRAVARAFAAWFHLVNLAEDQAQARRLVEERRRSASEARPHDGTLLAAFHTLRDADVAPEVVARLIADLRVRLVLTAHPTETRRRSVLAKLVRAADVLRRLDTESLAPEDEAELTRQLAEEVTALWLTDETRDRAPTVVDEVRNVIFWFDASIFWVVPRVIRELRTAVAATYPGLLPELDRPLTFGSWVGGDRDGNPNVTPAVTAAALDEHQRMAIHLLRRSIESMHAHLSVALARGVSPALTDAHGRALGAPRWQRRVGVALRGPAAPPLPRARASASRTDRGRTDGSVVRSSPCRRRLPRRGRAARRPPSAAGQPAHGRRVGTGRRTRRGPGHAGGGLRAAPRHARRAAACVDAARDGHGPARALRRPPLRDGPRRPSAGPAADDAARARARRRSVRSPRHSSRMQRRRRTRSNCSVSSDPRTSASDRARSTPASSRAPSTSWTSSPRSCSPETPAARTGSTWSRCSRVRRR
jgi:hypothetical protein